MSDVTCSVSGCPGRSQCKNRAKIPGIRAGETCEQADERKWIAYRLRARFQSTTSSERNILTMVFALDGGSRPTLEQVGRQLGENRTQVVRLIRAALQKIGWHKRVNLGE